MKRREYTAEYKAKIILEIIAGDKSTSQIASRENINPKQLQNWKKEFCDNAAKAFAGNKAEKEAEKLEKQRISEKERLEKKVGQLTLEVDFLKEFCDRNGGLGWEEKFGYKR